MLKIVYAWNLVKTISKSKIPSVAHLRNFDTILGVNVVFFFQSHRIEFIGSLGLCIISLLKNYILIKMYFNGGGKFFRKCCFLYNNFAKVSLSIEIEMNLVIRESTFL